MEFVSDSFVAIVNIQFIECNSVFSSSLYGSRKASYAGSFNDFPFKTKKLR